MLSEAPEVTLQKQGINWYGYNRATGQKKYLGRVAAMTEKAARQKLVQWAAQIMARPAWVKPAAGPKPTLETWCDRHLAMNPKYAPATVDLYKYTTALLAERLGKTRKIATITSTDAREWLAWMQRKGSEGGKGFADSGAAIHVRNAKTMFNLAVKEGHTHANPFADLNGASPDVDKDWPNLTEADIHKLVAAVPATFPRMSDADRQSWINLVALCGWAGLRRGEALRVQWPDVDHERQMLKVLHIGARNKKKRTRMVRMEPPLAAVLRQGQAMGLGKPFDLPENNLRRNLRRIAKQAGFVQWSRPYHTLRKACETRWNDAGFPAHVVTSWMGHTGSVALKHYLQVDQHWYAGQSPRQLVAEKDAQIVRLKEEIADLKRRLFQAEGERAKRQAG